MYLRNAKQKFLRFFLKTRVSSLNGSYQRDRQPLPGNGINQDWDEWVVLLKGGAGILFEGDRVPIALKPGDYIHIPAHKKHRVEWTDPHEKTIWLAIHIKNEVRSEKTEEKQI